MKRRIHEESEKKQVVLKSKNLRVFEKVHFLKEEGKEEGMFHDINCG
jgi:hypothetical protein